MNWTTLFILHSIDSLKRTVYAAVAKNSGSQSVGRACQGGRTSTAGGGGGGGGGGARAIRRKINK